MKEQIIAIGGGGFSHWGMYSSETIKLSQYFLDQTGKKNPSICFLPTASADDARYTMHFYTRDGKTLGKMSSKRPKGLETSPPSICL